MSVGKDGPGSQAVSRVAGGRRLRTDELKLNLVVLVCCKPAQDKCILCSGISALFTEDMIM